MRERRARVIDGIYKRVMLVYAEVKRKDSEVREYVRHAITRLKFGGEEPGYVGVVASEAGGRKRTNGELHNPVAAPDSPAAKLLASDTRVS